MNYFAKLGRKLVSKLYETNSGMAAQHKQDMHTIAVLIQRYNHFKQNEGIESSSEPDLLKFLEHADALEKDDELDEYVRNQISEQVVHVFSALDRYAKARQELNRGNDFKASLRECRTDLLNDVGFWLQVKRSSIEGAGDGLFLHSGSVCPGTVVSLYPGLVHLKEHTLKSEYLQSLLPDENMMLIARFDDILIDGRTADKVPQNPYALAHKVNHAPTDDAVNVQQIAFSYPHDPLNISGYFPHKLRKYVPNAYAKEPSLAGNIDRSSFMHTIALVSTQHIQAGQEIFVDYRLSPSNPNLPAWYTPLHADIQRRMWTPPQESK